MNNEEIIRMQVEVKHIFAVIDAAEEVHHATIRSINRRQPRQSERAMLLADNALLAEAIDIARSQVVARRPTAVITLPWSKWMLLLNRALSVHAARLTSLSRYGEKATTWEKTKALAEAIDSVNQALKKEREILTRAGAVI